VAPKPMALIPDAAGWQNWVDWANWKTVTNGWNQTWLGNI